ncbi:MAG: heparin lyase I family protein, partial [Candidatus Paceibacterota bacterium]
MKKISLREAVMYFGYSSDHIAYLIRKGKIAGEKIYKKEYWKVSRKGLLEYIKGRQKASSSRNFFEFLASNKYFFKKYLSLKEASEVSGYASDYIGYLVRQGKVSGRKFYCGSSWLTTRDAVKEYLDSKPSRKDEKFFNFSFHFSGGKKYFSLKISKASLAISMAVVFFGGLVALASSSQDQNQIVKIFPSQAQTGKSIDGRGWQNEDRIKGSPDVGPEGDINYFSDQNSAVYKGGPDALLLSGFNSTQLDLDSDEINDEIFKDIEKKEGQDPAGEPSQDLDSQPVQSGEQEVSDPQADASGSEPSEQESAEEGGGVQSEPSQGEVEGSENIQEKTEGEGNFSQNGEASGGLPGSSDPLPDPNGAIGGQSEGPAGSDGADQSSGGLDGPTAAPAESEPQGSGQPEVQSDASAGQVSFLDRLKGIFGRSTVKAEELLNFKDVSQKQLVSAKINISLAGGIKDPDIVPAGQVDPVQGFWGKVKNTFSAIFKNFPQIARAQTSEAVEPPAREQEADILAGQTNELSIEVPLIGEEEASSSNQEEQQNEDSADIPDQDAGQAVEEGQDQLQGGPAAESGQAEPEEGQIKTRDAIFGGEKDINSQEPVMEGVENDPQPVSEEIISNPDDKLIIWYGVNGGSGSIEWSKLGSISQESFSNASNGGYLSFDASFLSSWDDIEGLQIKIEGAVGGQMENPIYVDSFWVEAEYQELGETVKDFELKILKDGWKADEEPSFELVRKTPETSAAEKFFTGIGFALGITKQEEPEPEIKADLSVPDKNSGRGKMEELASGDILKNIVREKGREKREIKIAKKSFSGPGKYSFSLSVEDKGIVYEFTQDFTWGVLAINTNKSVYVPGEEAFLQMGVLNEKGSTVCNAGLEVEITSPGGIKTILTTERTVSEEIPEDSISSSSQERSAEEQGNFGENGGAVEEEGSIDGDASVSSSEAVLPEGSIVPSDKGSQVVQEEPEEGAAPEDPQTSQEEEQANQPEMDIPQEGQSGAETTIEAADDGGSSLQRIKDIFGFSYAKAEENDLAGPADPIINNGAVTRNSSCGPNNVTSLPDYSAYYKVEEIGSYHIKLTASTNNGLYSIEDSITVQDSVPFDVERIGPTRIYPMSAYEMTLKIKANEDFNGSISEPLPEGFEVVSASGQYSEQKKEGERSIVWDADIKQGEIYELKYRFDAPDISPYLYLLGPMKMGGLESEITLEPDRIVFQELRQWQLASDATTTFQYIFGGDIDTPATAGATEYIGLMGDGLKVFDATEANVQQIMPTAGTLSDFKFKVKTAPGAGNSWTFTIRKNAADTDLSVSIAGTDTLSNLDEDQVSVSAGDEIAISAVGVSSPTAAGATYWTAKFTPSTAGETILMSHGGTLSTNLYFLTLIGHKVFDSARFDGQILFPTSGTLKNFYVGLSVAPGGVTGRTFKLEKNTVDSSVAVTITGAATTSNDVANTLSVSAGEQVTIQQTAISGAPAGTEAKFGAVFVPDTPGQWFTGAVTDNAINNLATEYQHLTCGDSTLTATENEQYALARETTAKAMYVVLSTDPGTSPDQFTFTLRRNGTTDTDLAVTIVANDTTGNFSTDVSISDDDSLSLSIVPGNSPSAVPKLQSSILFYNAPTGGASNITVSGTVYSDEGSNGIGAGKTVRVKVNGAGSFSTTTNASSSYSISDVAVASAGDVLTVYLDEGTEKAAAITRITSTAANVTDMDLYQNRIIARHHDSGPLTIADLDEYDSAGDSDIQFTASSTAGTLTISSSTQELFVWASSTLTLTGSTTAGSISLGSLDVNGTLNASSTQTITISGSADITGGTFNTASSTVNFTTDYDTSIPAITYYNLQLSGSSVFYDDFETGDFSKWSEGAGTTSGSIFQATTSLKYAGAYGVAAKSGGVDGYAMAQNEGLGQYQTMIQDFYQYLPSDWNWGTASGISIANFSDSSWNDRFSIGIEEMEGGSTDTSFTYNYWNSSEAQQWDDTGVNFTKGQWQHIKAEIFVATSTGYVKIWLDGSLIVNNTGINTGSTNIDNVMVGTDWTDGATPFFYQDNCVYDNNAAPTYTLAAAAGQTLTINNNLTVGSGLNLLNVTGATYNPTIDVNGSVSIIANSAFIAPTSSPFTVGGSWTNTGTFTHSTSTVTFDATSESKTISTGGSPFYTLTFNGSGGGWTLNDAATTTNTLNVTAGTLTWGDGNGDNLVTGATTTIANGAVMQSKQDLAQGSTMTWTSTGNIALSGTLDLGKN